MALLTSQNLNPCPMMTSLYSLYMVGDDAFALKTWMMKPLSLRQMTHEQRVFNYRLARASSLVVETAFGLLAARFRCLLTTMTQSPERVSIITYACCVLHNFLRIRNPTLDVTLVDHDQPASHEFIPGSWRENAHLPDIEPRPLRLLVMMKCCGPPRSFEWLEDRRAPP